MSLPWGFVFPRCSTAAPQSETDRLGLLTAAAATPSVYSAALVMSSWRHTATSAGRYGADPSNRRPVGVAAALHTTAAGCRLPPAWSCVCRSVSQMGGADTPPARLSPPPMCTTHGCQSTPAVTRRGERPATADAWPGLGRAPARPQHTHRTHRAHTQPQRGCLPVCPQVSPASPHSANQNYEDCRPLRGLIAGPRRRRRPHPHPASSGTTQRTTLRCIG